MHEECPDHRADQQADGHQCCARNQQHQRARYLYNACEIAEPLAKADFLEYAEPKPTLRELVNALVQEQCREQDSQCPDECVTAHASTSNTPPDSPLFQRQKLR